MRNGWSFGTALALVLGFSNAAFAGVIASVVEIDPPGSAFLIGPVTFAANNDNTDASLEDGAENGFLAVKDFNTVDPIDLVFGVADSGGTTEYASLELVVNSTGLSWADYRFELGFGTRGNFIRSGDDGLDFDTPDRDPAVSALVVGTQFSSGNHDDDTIEWKGGLVPHGSVAFFTFSLDVPDADGIPEFAWSGDAGYQFTLRQYPGVAPDGGGDPVIPEPSSLWLLGLGGAAAFLKRRRNDSGVVAWISAETKGGVR